MARPAAEAALAKAGEKYQTALTIKSDLPDALHGLGNVIFEQARRSSGDKATELLAKAAEKYDAVLEKRADYVFALNGAGNVLFEQGRRAPDKLRQGLRSRLGRGAL